MSELTATKNNSKQNVIKKFMKNIIFKSDFKSPREYSTVITKRKNDGNPN